jgi:hypothetical protein
LSRTSIDGEKVASCSSERVYLIRTVSKVLRCLTGMRPVGRFFQNECAEFYFVTLALLCSQSVSAQTLKDLVAAWEPVSIVNIAADGTRSDQWGTPPRGSLLFTPDGRFSIILHRADLPKIIVNNRAQGTSDENKAVVQGSIAFYGTYNVEDLKTLILKIEGATYPNSVGTDQRSEITRFNSGQMTWTILSSRGGTNIATLRRVN